MHMGLTKTVNQIAKSKQTFDLFVFWQVARRRMTGGRWQEAYSSIFLSSCAVIHVSFLPRFRRR